MKLSRRILIIIIIPILYFLWEVGVLYFTDSYCKSVADRIPVELQQEKIIPSTSQQATGMQYISKYYDVKWKCEENIKIPTPLFDFLNKHFP